eukprot:CAMPEP_0177724206 /NCGR_PEP_ID=MMETSP0484_2-20121128/18608_1 /TAXON_ID=354590 /ORGANISM="Rhodomonas lens, Strain RHODO" /LENGTH=268 /DNA_ID=CAMNT_0019236665 /DNA_START=72 /DNA_END=878 /DNA_ORIENTATION=-
MQIRVLVLAMFGVMAANAFMGPTSGLVGSVRRLTDPSLKLPPSSRCGLVRLRAQSGDDASEESALGSLGVPSRKRTSRFRDMLDVNPGRSKRLERSEQEERYRQMLAVNPNDVDTLCGYACFLSTVKGDYVATAQMYSSALQADPARARRITVQLWADVEAARVQDERQASGALGWLSIFKRRDKAKTGLMPKPKIEALLLFHGLKREELDEAMRVSPVLPDGMVKYSLVAEAAAARALPLFREWTVPWLKLKLKDAFGFNLTVGPVT